MCAASARAGSKSETLARMRRTIRSNMIGEASTAVATPDAVLRRSVNGYQHMAGKPAKEVKEQYA
jgi:hypothetical protein